MLFSIKNRGINKRFILNFIVAIIVLMFCSLSFCQEQNRIFIDQKGNEVKVPGNVERVITPYPIATNIIYTIGGQKKLVGIDDNSPNDVWLQRIDPDIGQIVKVGMPWSVNIEEVISLNPDIVIGVSGEVSDKLREIGIPVIELDLGSGSDLESAIRLIGGCLGLEERSNDLASFYQNKMALIEEQVKGIPESQKVRVMNVGRDSIYTAAIGECYQDRLINSGGGVNVAGNLIGEGWFTQVSIEQILDWDPQIIFVPPYLREGSVEDILNNPKWKNIEAVKNKKVFTVPKGVATWDTPEPESFLAPIWMAQIFYPDHFENIDIKQEIKNFYIKYYGLNISDKEIEQILNP
jgi:iron complex transport system substrate-binding protein